jgi:hypothetical protein
MEEEGELIAHKASMRIRELHLMKPFNYDGDGKQQ